MIILWHFVKQGPTSNVKNKKNGCKLCPAEIQQVEETISKNVHFRNLAGICWRHEQTLITKLRLSLSDRTNKC